MLATAIIIFREVLEAALIIGIILAATRGVKGRRRWVAGGIAMGLAAAGVVAAFAGTIADAAEGLGQEIFNASVLMAAVLMLAWHNIWMASHARELVARMNRVGVSVTEGVLPLRALAVVTSLAVLREGSEVVLFLYGLAASADSYADLVFGGGLGLASGVGVGAALYLGLLKIPTRMLFTTTSWLILFLAAGLASEAARYLVQADLLPALSAGPVWDTSAFIADHSLAGQILHTLLGYTPRPLGVQILVFTLTLALIGGFMIRTARSKRTSGAASLALLCLGLAGAPMFAANPAEAADKVYSPIVHEGEIELEFTGHRDKGGDQVHKWEIGYGVSERWSTAFFLETENLAGESLEAEAVAWENIIQLTEQGQFWLDAGLYLEYERHLKNGGHDKFEGKLLLEKQTGEFLTRANLILEKEVTGPGREGWEFEYAWQSKYRYRKEFEIGLEGFGGFGEIGDFAPSNEQKHSVGPVVTGILPLAIKWNFRYEVGYQIGISRAAPDNRVKAIIELETYF